MLRLALLSSVVFLVSSCNEVCHRSVGQGVEVCGAQRNPDGGSDELPIVPREDGGSVEDNICISSLQLPTTPDTDSVQATLKQLLLEKLQSGGIQLLDKNLLRGDASQVTLEDDDARLTCTEGPMGQLAMQAVACEIIRKDAVCSKEEKRLKLPTTSNVSVQSVLKELLYTALEARKTDGGALGATLSGNYETVTLQDTQARVICQEASSGMLAVQTFGCEFEKQ